MANIPAMQFYPGDFWREPGCRGLSCAAMGAYCRLLVTLFDCDPPGTLTGTHDYLKRLTGSHDSEWSRILGEIEMAGVLDIVTDDNGNITLASRRIIREQIARGANKKRQQAFRDRHKDTPKAASVTNSNNPSSSSSSTSKKEEGIREVEC